MCIHNTARELYKLPQMPREQYALRAILYRGIQGFADKITHDHGIRRTESKVIFQEMKPVTPGHRE